MQKIPRQSSTPFRRPHNSTPSWWVDYLRSHPVQSALVFTNIIGGILLLAFFVQLRVMPELDLAGASAVLLAVALTGLTFVFCLTVCAFAGGMALHNYGREAQALKKGYGALLLVTPTIAGVGMSIYLTFTTSAPDFSNISLSIGGSIVLGAIIYATWMPGCSTRTWETVLSYGSSYALLSLLWTMVAFMAILSFWVLCDPNGDADYKNLCLVTWVIWCLICNLGTAQPRNNQPTLLAGIWVLSFIILLVLTNNGTALPKAVVNSLGLGELPVALVVTRQGCQSINKASGQEVCKIKPEEKSALVCPALLRSRIGSPYFIGLSPLTEKGAWPAILLPARTATVALPKSEVLSWSRIESKPRNKTGNTSDTSSNAKLNVQQAVVTYLHNAAKGTWLADQCSSFITNEKESR